MGRLSAGSLYRSTCLRIFGCQRVPFLLVLEFSCLNSMFTVSGDTIADRRALAALNYFEDTDNEAKEFIR